MRCFRVWSKVEHPRTPDSRVEKIVTLVTSGFRNQQRGNRDDKSRRLRLETERVHNAAGQDDRARPGNLFDAAIDVHTGGAGVDKHALEKVAVGMRRTCD